MKPHNVPRWQPAPYPVRWVPVPDDPVAYTNTTGTQTTVFSVFNSDAEVRQLLAEREDAMQTKPYYEHAAQNAQIVRDVMSANSSRVWSFDDLISETGIDENSMRIALWDLIGEGIVDFTNDRHFVLSTRNDDAE